jgi:putative membrane protein
MRKSVKLLSAAAAITAVAGAYAQGQTPPGQQSSPAAASSEHQREATRSSTSETPATTTTSPEASAASSPHQHETAAMKPSESKLKMAKQEGAVPEEFVKQAAMDGMAEVQLGKVALERSQDPKIRQFAQRMVDDHSKANDKLAAVAKSKNLELPKALDAEHEAKVQAMSSKSGAAFDAAYREHMNADHSEAIALFEGASTSKDPQIASLAKQTLPTLKEHKHLAEALPASGKADASQPQAR